MGLYSYRPNRLAIPRWRDFKDTSNSGELQQEKIKKSPIVPTLSCAKQIENWNKEKTIANALELINSAFVSNEKAAAAAAASFVIDNCKDNNNPILRIAHSIVDTPQPKNEDEPFNTSFDALENKIRIKIATIRQRLSCFPNNAVLWIDYARWLTVIGKFYDAERAIKIAIQLAPQNIFIVRSAVRFFIHKSKHDIRDEDSLMLALKIIRTNPATKSDPWLMATEISLCSYLKKTSNLMKAGFSLVEAKQFSPFALSELNSALATVELQYNTTKSKRLFTSSLIDPNENSVAQAQWATKTVGELPINLLKTNSHEANSYQKGYLEEWESSFDESLNWLVDEPFSCEPANHASYLAAAAIDNNNLAITICNFGLRSNPKEFTLLNNKAYSLAIENRVGEAEKTFNQIDVNTLGEYEKVAYTATKGLISYRNGYKEIGSSLYDQAEQLAKKGRDERTAFRVRIYKARAEFICGCGSLDKTTTFTNLMTDLEKFKHPDLIRTMSNLKKRLEITDKK